MSNKLTSLTGFGEGDPKPERKSSINARIALNRAASGGGDEGRTPHKYGAKTKALSAKMGKKDTFIAPGHKRRLTHRTITDDAGGRTVEFGGAANYLRKKK